MFQKLPADEIPWEDYRPAFALHILGRYEQRQFDEDGLPETQHWTAYCEKCNTAHQGACDSGQVKKHIQRFAVVHMHADPLAAPRVVAPGSLRVGKPEGSE